MGQGQSDIEMRSCDLNIFLTSILGCYGTGTVRYCHAVIKRMFTEWGMVMFKKSTSCNSLASSVRKGKNIHLITTWLPQLENVKMYKIIKQSRNYWLNICITSIN